MGVLSVPSHSYVPVSRSRFVVAERKPSHVISSSSSAATISAKTDTVRRPNQVLQLTKPPRHEVLFKDDQYMNLFDDEVALTQSNLATGQGEGIILGKEVRMVMQRLDRVTERMRELELEKLKGRLRGDMMSHEDGVLVEMMSREIVSSFLEKPIQYLNSSDGKLEDKLKDFKFFVGILEQSCFMNEEMNTHV